ncbi:V-set and immunoglobulin domain-containing protein 4-like isoform X4 [Pelobates fuscus]|uniref:V-set and immunoglobulin domain-containing protein 4-like isoform X4 n=1 Tax=Pelobates fuscus TaxID=191477 RepID=UPI002FE4501F
MDFLIVFGIFLAGKTALCDLSLNVEHTVQGFRGYSVVIPCTYEPSKEYTEQEVLWFKGSTKLFQRIKSEDHVFLGELRGKITVSKSPPGDVSLTINKLSASDRGDYECQVISKSINLGTRTTMTAISTLTVSKEAPPTEKPKVNIITNNIPDLMTSKKVNTERKPDVITEFPPTVNPKVKITTESKTNIMTKNAPTKGRTTKFPHTNSREMNPHPRTVTASLPHNQMAGLTGFGGPLYIVLIFGLVCFISTMVLIVIVIKQRNAKKDDNVGVLTMSQLAEDIASATTTTYQCQPGASQCSILLNHYEPPTDNTEYQNFNAIQENDYEFLLTEKQNNI